MRAVVGVISVLLVAFASAFGCAQILGADEHRDLVSVVVTSNDAGIQTFDAIAEVPEAGDPDACAPNQKRCDGTCVPKASPEYGCANDGCTPCSIPNALEVKCTDDTNLCAFKKCTPGWLACGPATAGCIDQNSSPATCGGCGTPCGGPFPLCATAGCTATCPGGTTNCSNSCVDTQSSPTNCGGCGKGCPAALNGDAYCQKAQCFVTCRPGFAHCDLNPAGNCTALSIFYRDADGDGFGDSAQKQLACSAAAAGPGWSGRAGDCHDGNKDVFPGQLRLFEVSYKNIAGAPSFDYDCNGVETESPSVVHFPGCDANCQGAGLSPAKSGRTGSGVNDYCGSTTTFKCTAGGLSMQTSAGAIPVGPSCTTEVSSGTANPCH